MNRLKNAEKKYIATIQEWLTNPTNEDLPNDIVSAKIDSALQEFLQELCKDEKECAAFISAGNIADELLILPQIFEYFKTHQIYEAIVANCESAFAHTYFTESPECEQQRRDFLNYAKSQLTQ